jgi:alanine-synthesizing transaminase
LLSASTRLPRFSTVNAATRTLESLAARGVHVRDLTLSNPTRAGLRYPEDLLEPLGSPAGLDYAPQPLGLQSAREAVAADFERRGTVVIPDRIALTASTSEAYAWLFKLLCDPGDAVLVPAPSYPLFEHLTTLESVTATAYPLEYHDGWQIDLDALRRLITPRTRAVLVVSPNNPTGSCVGAQELEALDELCAEHALMLISDEVFADYPLERPVPPSALAATRSVVCALGGLSKTIGLPQAKLAWVAFGGPVERVHETLAAFELIADTYLSVSTPVQLALPVLLARGAEVRQQIQQRIAENLAFLQDAVRATPSISLLRADAGWSAVLQVPRYSSEEALVLDLLTSEHVLLHPGYFYDFAREAYLVVSLLTPRETFAEAVPRVLARASHPDRSGS